MLAGFAAEALLVELVVETFGDEPLTDLVGELGAGFCGELLAPPVVWIGMLSGGLLETPGAPTIAINPA